MTRDKWSSRGTFILAAIGSAVGLGNAWRFPGLVNEYGGGAFLFAYIIAMVIMGYPLLMMEITLGRKMQRGAPGAFRGINRKTEWIGWAGVTNAFVIVCYYAIVLAWVLYMVVEAFWFGGMTGNPDAASGVFFTNVIENIDIGAANSFTIPWGMLLAAVVAWAMIYWCIRKGTTSVGKVVKYTVFIPVILLVIMAINGFTMPNAMDGFWKLIIPDWSALANIQLWTAAFGQVFYSLSIMMAIMIAYGSFLPQNSDVKKDAIIIAVSDMAVSFLAGVVLFTTMAGTGNLGSITSSGIGTAFIVYPMALVTISNISWINTAFAVIFYLTLLTLAIDSAFSIVEGVSTAVSDKFQWSKRKTTLVICIVAGVISLLFCTRAGLSWLDVVDHWANEINLILIGVLECVAVGWCFKTSKLREEINRTTTGFRLGKWYDVLIKFICPVLLTVLFVWNIVAYFTGGGYGGYPIWVQIVAGWVVTAAVFLSGAIVRLIARSNKRVLEIEQHEKSWDEMD